ncbi:MAG: GTP 3',8-cyclase MoaA [Candidatus Bathyarchaeota archaeon]|nr:GTP 3',8-cyclase MoaA [Candidatus Termiticorpusculum sp.]
MLNLRISVTQQCNYNCTYCHREGEAEQSNNVEMTVEEIVRIAKVAVDLGVTRVKLTGGEPLMRKDLCQIVSGIADIAGLKDLSLTTNGSMLSDIAKELHTAGLNRINISLATLNSEIYHKLTSGTLDKALAGIEAAVKAGFNPVKLNMVILKGINEQDSSDMIAYAEKTRVILQLIELDPVNINDTYYKQYHHSLDEQKEMLRQKALNIKQRHFMHNRLIYHLPNTTTIEVVHPIENTDFCMHCTRLRITSNGKLKPCLMQNNQLTDILTPIRQGADNEKLKQLFKQANQQREPYNKNTNT